MDDPPTTDARESRATDPGSPSLPEAGGRGSTADEVTPGDRASEPLAVVLALMPDAAVVVDVDGSIVSVNEHAESLFGYRSDELIGRPIELLVPERFRHEHRHHRSAYASSPQTRPMGVGLNLYGRRHDGSEFPVEISLAPVQRSDRALVVAAVRDVTDSKAAVAAQAQLASIVLSSGDGIVSMSPQGIISSWNPGAMRLFGYQTSEVIGEHVSRLVPDDASEVFEELLDAARSGRSSSPRDTQWLTSDGRRLEVAISVWALAGGTSSAGAGFSVLVRDITERKRAEEGLRRQERFQARTAEVRLSLLSNVPIRESLELLCGAALELVDADSAVVLQIEGDRARSLAQAGGARRLVGASGVISPVPTVVARAISSGTPQTGKDDRRATRTTAEEPGVLTALPIPSEHGRTAALVVESSAPAGLAEGEIELAASLADQTGLALELAATRADRDRLLISGDRERIARDLHDLVIQRLFGAGLHLQAAQSLIDNPRASERISSVIDDLDTTIREIRDTIFALGSPPRALGELGELIAEHSASMAERLGFEPTVAVHGTERSAIDEHVQLELLAVVREALANIARHAQANRAEITVEVDEELRLVVVDDGVGIANLQRMSGLANARARAELLGGAMTLSVPDGGGTRLEWRVPLRDAAD